MNCTSTVQVRQPALPSASLKVVCGIKRCCKQMNFCEEARAFLNQYGISHTNELEHGNLLTIHS